MPSLELLVVDEGVNSPVLKGIVEIATETTTSIFPSEAKEHVIGESVTK